jgi:hypothetical protein
MNDEHWASAPLPLSGFCCKTLEEKLEEGKTYGGITFETKWGFGWVVLGCCGSNCIVLDKLKFCPFCGTELKEPEGT